MSAMTIAELARAVRLAFVEPDLVRGAIAHAGFKLVWGPVWGPVSEASWRRSSATSTWVGKPAIHAGPVDSGVFFADTR